MTHFGHIIPPPPVTYACSVAPNSVYPGDPITVTGTAANLNPKKTATYTWTSTGERDLGEPARAPRTIDTKGAAPGTYTITGHVTEGLKPGQSADCSGQFTVKPFLDPPTMSACSANPSTVDSGGSSTITARATAASPQNRPLTYSYSATSGSVSGTDAPRRPCRPRPGVAAGSNSSVTVTCNVVDDLGTERGSKMAMTVNCANGPSAFLAPPPAPMAWSLCSVSFERDAKRPDSCGQRSQGLALDDVALSSAAALSDAKLSLVGNENAKEAGCGCEGSEDEASARNSSRGSPRARSTRRTTWSRRRGLMLSRITVYTGYGRCSDGDHEPRAGRRRPTFKKASATAGGRDRAVKGCASDSSGEDEEEVKRYRAIEGNTEG